MSVYITTEVIKYAISLTVVVKLTLLVIIVVL